MDSCDRSTHPFSLATWFHSSLICAIVIAPTRFLRYSISSGFHDLGFPLFCPQEREQWFPCPSMSSYSFLQYAQVAIVFDKNASGGFLQMVYLYWFAFLGKAALINYSPIAWIGEFCFTGGVRSPSTSRHIPNSNFCWTWARSPSIYFLASFSSRSIRSSSCSYIADGAM